MSLEYRAIVLSGEWPTTWSRPMSVSLATFVQYYNVICFEIDHNFKFGRHSNLLKLCVNIGHRPRPDLVGLITLGLSPQCTRVDITIYFAIICDFFLFFTEGFVDFTNFLVLVSKFKREGDSEEEILEAFRVFDPQFTGVISVIEFRQVMMNYGERLTEPDVDNLVSMADVDRKGEIRYMGR